MQLKTSVFLVLFSGLFNAYVCTTIRVLSLEFSRVFQNRCLQLMQIVMQFIIYYFANISQLRITFFFLSEQNFLLNTYHPFSLARCFQSMKCK